MSWFPLSPQPASPSHSYPSVQLPKGCSLGPTSNASWPRISHLKQTPLLGFTAQVPGITQAPQARPGPLHPNNHQVLWDLPLLDCFNPFFCIKSQYYLIVVAEGMGLKKNKPGFQSWLPFCKLLTSSNVSIIILDMGTLLVKKQSPLGLVGINEDRVHDCG